MSTTCITNQSYLFHTLSSLQSNMKLILLSSSSLHLHSEFLLILMHSNSICLVNRSYSLTLFSLVSNNSARKRILIILFKLSIHLLLILSSPGSHMSGRYFIEFLRLSDSNCSFRIGEIMLSIR
jgi:hypothetical protein